MSDYLSSKASKQNLHRAGGASGGGIVFALLVLLGVIAMLAMVGAIGGIGGAGDATEPGGDAIITPAINPAIGAPPVPTE
jgi:hypothetical protein